MTGINLIGQASILGGNGTSPVSVTYSSTAGTTLILAGHLFDNGNGEFVAPTSVSDTAGNVWQVSVNNTQAATTVQTPPLVSQTDPSDGASAHMSDWVAWCIGAKAVTSVTIAWEGGAVSTWRRITLSEWSGIGSFDNSWAGGSLTPATSATTGPVNLSIPGSLIIFAVDFGGSGAMTFPAGWTAFTSQPDLGYYLTGATTGAYSPVFTNTQSDAWAGAIAVFKPAIEYNTGTSAATTNATSQAFTIPNTGGLLGTGVMVNDVMLLDVSVFTEDATPPTVSFAGGGGSWQLVPMTDGSANPQLSASGSIYSYVWTYYRVATSADIGATVTISESGSPAGTTWFGVSMAAYTGANPLNPIDRAGGFTTAANTQDYTVMPTETARIYNDWVVYLVGGGFNVGAGAVPPAGATQRQFSINSGGTGTAIADSNGPTGLNAVGGGQYTNGGHGPAYMSGFTICLAPAGIYKVQSAVWAAGASGSFTSNVTPSNSVLLYIMDYNVAVSTPISSSSPLYNGAAVTGASLLFHANNPDISPNNRAMYAAAWLLPNVQSAGTSVSYTNTGGNNDGNSGHVIAEILGLGPSPSLDAASSNPSTAGADSGTAVSSGSTGAMVGSSGLVVGCFMDDATTTPTGPGGPWTTIGEQYGLAGYQMPTSSGGTYAFTGTISPAEQWAAGVAIINPTAPSGGGSNVSGNTATVAVAGVLGTESVTLPGPVAAVTVLALEGNPSVSATASPGQVSVAAVLGSAIAYNPQSGSGLLKLLFP